VLDIGCGSGQTTREVARMAHAGSALGVDISGPAIERARGLAAAQGVRNVSFEQADAQVHRFARERFDLVISRFGTMFFADSEAAFANLARALRPDGRLCLATWQPRAANEWLVVPASALLRHTDAPAPTDADQTGMFAQSDPSLVSSTLEAAGFADIAIEGAAVDFTFGRSVDDAVDYLTDGGPGRMILDTIPEGPARQAALADLRDALADHHGPSGVGLGGAIWLITAIRPLAPGSS
jgi:SAM-dependent methyltransferase